MPPIKDIVQVEGEHFVVESESPGTRRLIAPMGPYINVIQQTKALSTRDGSEHWRTSGGADFCDPTPEEKQLLTETQEALEAARLKRE